MVIFDTIRFRSAAVRLQDSNRKLKITPNLFMPNTEYRFDWENFELGPFFLELSPYRTCELVQIAVASGVISSTNFSQDASHISFDTASIDSSVTAVDRKCGIGFSKDCKPCSNPSCATCDSDNLLKCLGCKQDDHILSEDGSCERGWCDYGFYKNFLAG